MVGIKSWVALIEVIKSNANFENYVGIMSIKCVNIHAIFIGYNQILYNIIC
jgi:hypothetical protein